LLSHYDKYKSCLQSDPQVRACFQSIPQKFKKSTEVRELVEMMEAKFSLEERDMVPSGGEVKEGLKRFDKKGRVIEESLGKRKSNW
jgi:hypothetical protein